MGAILAIALAITQASWDQQEYIDAFHIWGQSTCLGLDSGAGAETTNANGNKAPFEYYYGLIAGLTSLSGWPLHDIIDTSACTQPVGGRLYSGCTGDNSYTGPRKHFADYFTAATGRKAIVGITAVPGVPYDPWFKFSQPYYKVQAQTFMEMYGARYNGRLHGTAACHGEADYTKTAAQYRGYMEELQSDLDDAAKRRIRGNSGFEMPLYLTQWSSCSYVGAGYASTLSCGSIQGIVDAGKNNPGKLPLVQTSYNYTYASGPHLNAAGNKMRGAKMMQAMLYGPTWSGVVSSSIARVGDAYVITYTVLYPPLVWDTTLVTNPGDYGFIYVQDSVAKQINTPVLCTGPASPHAACSAANQVVIEPVVAPGGTARSIYYAAGCWYASGGSTIWTDSTCISAGGLVTPGRTTGQRGNLRDSDTATWNATPMYNWAFHEGWTSLP